jgi:Holliday junction resolvase-like predicted endonuclease
VTAYTRGLGYEDRAATALAQDGYVVWQAKGSKGAADLIALKRGQVLLVQVKGCRERITGQGWNELLDLAERVGALALVADWPEWQSYRAGPMRLRRITGRHAPRSPRWLCEPFTTDEVARPAGACATLGLVPYPHARPVCDCGRPDCPRPGTQLTLDQVEG